MGREKDAQRLAKKIEKVATEFGMHSFKGQQKVLRDAMDAFERRVRPEELSSPVTEPAATAEEVAAGSGAATEAASDAEEAASQGAETHAAILPTVYDKGTIVVDADIVKGKPIRSVEVSCKIEYA